MIHFKFMKVKPPIEIKVEVSGPGHVDMPLFPSSSTFNELHDVESLIGHNEFLGNTSDEVRFQSTTQPRSLIHRVE
jgi:hypothetical protein